MISYLYLADDDTVGVGHIYEEDKASSKDQVEQIVRQATDAHYICLLSEETDFVEEAKKYESINDYVKEIIDSITIKGNE